MKKAVKISVEINDAFFNQESYISRLVCINYPPDALTIFKHIDFNIYACSGQLGLSSFPSNLLNG
jgi:hypothetical protein